MEPRTRQVDAIVVGGGPAGAVVAWRLARVGRSVALVDRRQRGETKACGHCLSAAGGATLRRLGLGDVLDAAATGRTSGMQVHHGRHGSLRLDLSATPGWLVDRATLDPGLLDRAAAAGAEIFRPAAARVLQLDERGAEALVEPDGVVLRGRLLVGADGLGSRVARAAGLAGPRVGRQYGFSLDLPAAATGPASRTIEMFLDRDGYIGVVADDAGRVHVGALAAAGDAPADVLARIAREHERFAAWGLGGAPPNIDACGPMPWRPADVAGPGVALVGDAAGYVEPFTGEGMTWALLGAETLGAVLASSPAWDARAADTWRRAYRRVLGRRLRACRWITATLARPLGRRCLFAVGRRAPATLRPLVRRVIAA